MRVDLKLKHLLLLAVFFSPAGYTGTYIGLSGSLMDINTDTGSTQPVTADISLGYAMEPHKFELVVRSSITDDNLNQLVTDIPIASSLLYRYTVILKQSLHLHLILGYSQVDVDASYIGAPGFTESYSGASYGIGFEEALKSIPQLKFKIDLMQLYRGDQLKINAYTAGFRYEF